MELLKKMRSPYMASSLAMLMLLVSCDIEETNVNRHFASINIDELTKFYATNFKSMENLEKVLVNSLNNSQKDENFTAIKISRSEEVIYSSNDIPNVFSLSQRELLAEYFTSIANASYGNLLTVIDSYKNILINSSSLSHEETNQIFTILDISEQSINSLENAINQNKASRNSDWESFIECLAKNGGTNIGRGLVEGFILGAISGGIIGANGGSVVLPGIGTATGAVGGAIFMGTSGAVLGAGAGALWTALDCLPHLNSSDEACIYLGSVHNNSPVFAAACME